MFDIRITSFVYCATCNVIPRGLSMASLLTSCHRKAESCPGPGAASFYHCPRLEIRMRRPRIQCDQLIKQAFEHHKPRCDCHTTAMASDSATESLGKNRPVK